MAEKLYIVRENGCVADKPCSCGGISDVDNEEALGVLGISPNEVCLNCGGDIQCALATRLIVEKK
ncbi:MAG: hypothetical protein WCV59_05260 [Parcubacteria group bacterium]|jgi:hypothetical protein